MLPALQRLLGGKVSIRACLLLGVAILVMFGLVEAGAWELHQVRLRSRVHQAIPKVREETTRELRLLTRAIDEYRARLGCYPPDHQLNQTPVVVDSITNQLLYELVGTVYDRTNDTFWPVDHVPAISGKLLKEFFNVSCLKNSAAQAEGVKQFIRATDIPGMLGVSEKPPVGVLAFFPNWEGIDAELLEEFPLAGWQYNCSVPVHNPKSYDLWIEIQVPGSKIVMGNW